jgi:hypothetical protein
VDTIAIDTFIEHLVTRAATLDREGCKAELRACGPVKIDFTDEYLDSLSLDKLRHFVIAAQLHRRKAIRQ